MTSRIAKLVTSMLAGEEKSLARLISIAAIIVVNKADHEGAERLAAQLRATLGANLGKSEPSIITTQAINDIGIKELYQIIDKRRKNY